METVWKYTLSENVKMRDDFYYEGQICISGSTLFLVTKQNTEKALIIHTVDVNSGIGNEQKISYNEGILPSKCFFVEHNENVFYTQKICMFTKMINLYFCIDFLKWEN